MRVLKQPVKSNEEFMYVEGIGEVRLVPGKKSEVNVTSLKRVRSNLDFQIREEIVGIRFKDMMTVAREFFDREDIRDLVDLSEYECRQLGAYMIREKDNLRKDYPKWR